MRCPKCGGFTWRIGKVMVVDMIEYTCQNNQCLVSKFWVKEVQSR